MRDDLIKAISIERLGTYRTSDADNFEVLLKRYSHNLILSESLYSAISIVEVALRNFITSALEKELHRDWLTNELSERLILTVNDHEQLFKAGKNITMPRKLRDGTIIIPDIKNGKLIAELTFGFWVHLFNADYYPALWFKYKNVFKNTFPNYANVFKPAGKENPTKRISLIYTKLRMILKLRNRIYHNEPIFNHPAGLDNIYTDIMRVACAMSPAIGEYIETICRYKEIKSKLSI